MKGGKTHTNEDTDKRISMQCFGTGVGGDWEVRLLEGTELPRIKDAQRMEFIVTYGAWVEATAAVVESIVFAPEALRPGVTAMATLTMAQAP